MRVINNARPLSYPLCPTPLRHIIRIAILNYHYSVNFALTTTVGSKFVFAFGEFYHRTRHIKRIAVG
jgi:hypothetical protein